MFPLEENVSNRGKGGGQKGRGPGHIFCPPPLIPGTVEQGDGLMALAKIANK